MKRNKGNIALEALLSLTIISMCSILVYNSAQLVYLTRATIEENRFDDMMCQQFQKVKRCLLYCKLTKEMMDILP